MRQEDLRKEFLAQLGALGASIVENHYVRLPIARRDVMQRGNARPSQTPVVGAAPDSGRSESMADGIICLGIGVCSAVFMAVFLWFPNAVAALHLPAYVIGVSWPVTCLIALVAGIASTISARRSSVHRRLRVAAALMNLLVAGLGIVKMVGVLTDFNRAWGKSGIGP
jgi:hypothetical protein